MIECCTDPVQFVDSAKSDYIENLSEKCFESHTNNCRQNALKGSEQLIEWSLLSIVFTYVRKLFEILSEI